METRCMTSAVCANGRQMFFVSQYMKFNAATE